MILLKFTARKSLRKTPTGKAARGASMDLVPTGRRETVLEKRDVRRTWVGYIVSIFPIQTWFQVLIFGANKPVFSV